MMKHSRSLLTGVALLCGAGIPVLVLALAFLNLRKTSLLSWFVTVVIMLAAIFLGYILLSAARPD